MTTTRAYLDHASTSPLRPAARDAMVGWLQRDSAGEVGDPARIHAEGMTARVAVEQAREQVAGWLGVRPREVVLTSGAVRGGPLATVVGEARPVRSVIDVAGPDALDRLAAL